MEVGVRCLSTSPKKSAKDGYGYRDIPVSLGGLTFVPGQWAYCDGNGALVSDEELV